MTKPRMCNDSLGQLTSEELLDIMEDVEKAAEKLLDALRIDWRDDHNTQGTPERIAKMLVTETFRGRYFPEPESTEFPNVKKMDELMAIGPLDVKSTCAHHFQSFKGKAFIGVLPKVGGQLIGLSKFPRVVDHFARRPQIQEEMTKQIAERFQKMLHNPRGLIVIVRAKHYCMCMRGVNQEVYTTTSVAYGKLRTSANLKQEFFNLIRADYE